MSRIAPVPPQLAPPDVRAVYESVMKKFGRLPIPIAVAAHHPEVFAAYMGFERAFGRASKVEAQLSALAEYRRSSRFSELERLVLDYAVAMTATPVDVPETLFAELHRQLNDEQMVELTATIAWENYRARFDHALGIEAQGFSDGAYCVRPERPKG